MARKRRLPPGMQRRGNTYYAKFRANGWLVQKKLSGDFQVACQLLNELKARANRADFDLLDNDYPWKELKAEYLRFKEQTTRNPRDYREHLTFFEKYCRIGSLKQITPQYVLGFREARLAEGVSPKTINKQVGTLRNMLNMGVQWQRVGSNAIANVKPLRNDSPRKKRRALTIEEVESLFTHSPEYLRPVWRMFMVTGIRKTELINMLFDDIDFEQRTVIVQAGTANNHREREIPLDDEMLSIIAFLKEQSTHRKQVAGTTRDATVRKEINLSQEHVFLTKANTPWRNNLLTRFYTCCKRAGIEGAHAGGSVDIHSLRVSFITLALEGGATPKAVQEIVGHRTLDMTMNVYARATEQGKRQVITALGFGKASMPDHVLSIQGTVSKRRPT